MIFIYFLILSLFYSFITLVFCVLTALLAGAATGLGSSLGTIPGSQPSAPNLNQPSQIDPSSIERAYAALGLTYQGNQIQAQTSQPNMPNQGLQGQAGVRPLNPMGEFSLFSVKRHCLNCLLFYSLMLSISFFQCQQAVRTFSFQNE